MKQRGLQQHTPIKQSLQTNEYNSLMIEYPRAWTSVIRKCYLLNLVFCG